MDMNDLFLAGKSPRRELQLQGPRPPPLSVRKDSHKIRKPPVAPANRLHQPPPPPPRQPVIIYAVSPKVIHTNPNEFMALVQRLTGSSTAPRVNQPDPFVNSVGAVSPAARFAIVEKANKSRVTSNSSYDVADDIYRDGSRADSMLPTDFTTLVQRFTGSYVAPWANKPNPPFNYDGSVSPTVEKAEKSKVTNNIDDDVANELIRVGSRTGLMPPGILSPGLVPPPNDFIALLQRFTGSSTAPWVDQPDRTILRVTNNIGDGVADEFRRVGSMTGLMPPGILSPGPASLRPVPAAFFSPPTNGNPLGFIHDLISPAGFYNTGLNYSELSSLLQSPTPFVSPRLISPLPSMDLFNHFFDI